MLEFVWSNSTVIFESLLLLAHPKLEKPVLDLRLSLKPTAPVVPPKKPAPPPNKAAAAAALLKPASIPPKRPEKPQPSPLGAK